MKRLFMILLLSSWLFTSCQQQNPVESFQKMEWLLGTWKGEAEGQPFYENWVKLSDTEFSNVNFSLCNGDTLGGGYSKVLVQDGKIVYKSGSLVWELESINDQQVIFENSQYKETFTFTKTPKGEWHAHLKYANSEVEYTLQKTVDIGELTKNKPGIIEGNYSGYLEFNGKKLETSINFLKLDGKQAAVTSTPDNLQLNRPFNTVCYNPPFVKLSLQDGGKTLELNAKLEGDLLSGKVGGELPAEIHLKKQASTDSLPKNYTTEAILLTNDKMTLAGNLYLPKSTHPTGAVIMICGTGNHTKEEYNGWAHMLATKGIAVLTYDKRNVINFPELNIRQRSCDIALPGELESDVQTAINLLKTRKEIDPKKIGLLGFSQGAVIAPIVAANNPELAFIALISGNITTDREFIINQGLNKLRARNVSKEDLDKVTNTWNALFQYVTDKKNGDAIQKQLDEAYEKGYGQHSLPRNLPNDDEIKYLSTWNSFNHDPAKYLNAISIPVYVAFGDKDDLIPVQRSIQILNTIYANKPNLLTLKTYAGYNHFIKSTPNREHFDFPRFAPGYINDLTAWMLEKAK